MMKQTTASALIAVLIAITVGCSEETDTARDFGELDISVCEPDHGPFTLDIDNPYFPLPVGQRLVLEGKEDGELIRVEISVLNETEEVAGVTTRVVEEAEYEDGELIERSRNFFVQAPDGTVCYYGEDVDDYDDGKIKGHGGAWRVGEGANAPGIIMPGRPQVGMKFAQERAPRIAEDMSAIVAIGDPVSVPAGDYTDTVWALDWNPLEGDTSADGERKVYVRGIGLVIDEEIELVQVGWTP